MIRFNEKAKGFTLIELILVIALFSIIFTFLFTNLTRPKTFADIQSSKELILVTVKEAQSLAMLNPKQNYGVHFEVDKFILFEGDTYNPSDENNIETNLGTSVTIESNSLPNGEIIFIKLSGEIEDFTEGQDSFVLKENTTNESITFTTNKLGVIDVT